MNNHPIMGRGLTCIDAPPAPRPLWRPQLDRRTCPLILIPGLSLSVLAIELLRGHGYAHLAAPVWLAAAALLTAALAAQWLAYAHWLARLTALPPARALRLDLWSHLPLLLLPAYFIPAVGRLHNSGTCLLAGALAGWAGLRALTLLYLRRAALERLLARPHLLLALIVALAALLRVAVIHAIPFCGDEALFAGWSLLIASGRDLFLKTVNVDKPPLFFYTQALFFRLLGPTETVARLPNLVASLCDIVLLHELARHLFNRRTATVAALLLALSPLAIQYAPTGYTDPLMVTLGLAAGLAALRGRSLAAGVLLGLSAAAKQTGLIHLPLVLALGALPQGKPSGKRSAGRSLLRLAGGFAAVAAAVLAWDSLIRVDSPRFLEVGRSHYGGFGPAPLNLAGQRLEGWLQLAQYITGSPPLNALLLVGLPALLAYGLWRRRERPEWLGDWALAAVAACFLGLHALASFNLWDRYLLGLAPLAALLLARVLLLPGDALLPRRVGSRAAYGALVVALLVAALAGPVRLALAYDLPIGSDGGAFQGIDDVAEYIRGHVPANSVLFHRLLGWHYGFYLFDAPLAYHYCPSSEYLLDLAQRLPPEQGKYIVIPAWGWADELGACLAGAGWELEPLYHAHNRDGTTSLTLYRVQPAP